MNEHPEICLLIDRETRRSWFGRLFFQDEQFASNAQVLKMKLAAKWHRVRAADGGLVVQPSQQARTIRLEYAHICHREDLP
jgi:hypothetical protein